jgi:hypothetical protein
VAAAGPGRGPGIRRGRGKGSAAARRRGHEVRTILLAAWAWSFCESCLWPIARVCAARM